jgi:hypothetical protein
MRRQGEARVLCGFITREGCVRSVWVCGVAWWPLVGQGGQWSRCVGFRRVPWSRRVREREVRRAAARFFLFVAQDWHGSLPPPSKHYKTKGREYCYSRI